MLMDGNKGSHEQASHSGSTLSQDLGKICVGEPCSRKARYGMSGMKIHLQKKSKRQTQATYKGKGQNIHHNKKRLL